MIFNVSNDIIKLFEGDKKLLSYIAAQIPYEGNVKIYFYPMRAALGRTYYNNKRKNFTVSIHPKLGKARKKLVLLHELAHVIVLIKYKKNDVKGHGPEYFSEYKKIFYATGQKIFEPKEYQKIDECFSITTNYKQFNLCITANFCTRMNAATKKGKIFLLEASKESEIFVYSNEKYKILKKNSMYYTVENLKNGSISKMNKYVKVRLP